jgi:hypothetical protein
VSEKEFTGTATKVQQTPKLPAGDHFPASQSRLANSVIVISLGCSRLAQIPVFCPACKSEYRPGFAHRSDCEVDLIAELSKPQAEAHSNDLKRVWTGKDQERCVFLCQKFHAVSIPFTVDQSRRQSLQGVEEHYRIAVASEFFEKARRIVKYQI